MAYYEGLINLNSPSQNAHNGEAGLRSIGPQPIHDQVATWPFQFVLESGHVMGQITLADFSFYFYSKTKLKVINNTSNSN